MNLAVNLLASLVRRFFAALLLIYGEGPGGCLLLYLQ
jgi:hypothetical protein